MSNYLSNTSICSTSADDMIYTYAQGSTGVIVECRGKMEQTSNSPTPLYSYISQSDVWRHFNRDAAVAEAPKLFTPLAAVAYAPDKWGPLTERYVFYVDDADKIHAAVRKNNDDWAQDTSLLSLNIKCASYSKLAAITVTNDLHTFIYLYYQAADAYGTVKTATFSGQSKQWTNEKADLSDPPLFGTSLTAVLPRDGIRVSSAPSYSDAGRQPILYLQLESLKLAHAQGTEPAQMDGLDINGKLMVFSPHTSLTAIDDGALLYIIYKSNNGAIKIINIKDNQSRTNPTTLVHVPRQGRTQRTTDDDEKDISPTPKSAISACFSQDKNHIILFYQSLDRKSNKIVLYGLTLNKDLTLSISGWTFDTDPRMVEKLES